LRLIAEAGAISPDFVETATDRSREQIRDAQCVEFYQNIVQTAGSSVRCAEPTPQIFDVNVVFVS
jgi:hypothetical protein